MKQSEFLKYAFAQDGEKTAINVETDPTGKVSIQSGYGSPYSDDPSAGGKYIERGDFNWILNYFTKEIQALQLNGINELNNEILTTVGYPKGARCAVWINVKTAQLNRNGSSDPLCITIPIVSMKNSNKTDPYTSNTALFSDWWLDDGLQIGAIKTFQVNLSTPPSGYLELAPNNSSPSYVKSQYPRIQQILGSSSSSTWGYFRSTSTSNFTIINPRGRFPRAWSNGSSIDSGRQFDTLQDDATRDITYDDPMIIGNVSDNNYVYGFGSNQGSLENGGDRDWLKLRGALKSKKLQVTTNLFPSNPSTDYFNTRGLGMPYSLGKDFAASRVVPTANENRPYNFNQKMYIKV